MGSVKTFLHPRVVVTTVFFVVIVEVGVFSTSKVSLEVVLEISNTFFGARSNGRNVTLEPVSSHSSMKSPSGSPFSPLSSELPEVMLDTDELWRLVEAVDPPSEAIKAALTSGANEDQASRIEADKVGVARTALSSLLPIIGHHRKGGES